MGYDQPVNWKRFTWPCIEILFASTVRSKGYLLQFGCIWFQHIKINHMNLLSQVVLFILRLARTYVLWWPENTRACRGLLKKDVASKQKVKLTDKEKMFGSPFWKSMAHWWWLVIDFSPVTQDIHIAMELAKGWSRATPLPSRGQKSSTASSSKTYAVGPYPRRFWFSVSFFIKTCEAVPYVPTGQWPKAVKGWLLVLDCMPCFIPGEVPDFTSPKVKVGCWVELRPQPSFVSWMTFVGTITSQTINSPTKHGIGMY